MGSLNKSTTKKEKRREGAVEGFQMAEICMVSSIAGTRKTSLIIDAEQLSCLTLALEDGSLTHS